METPDIPDFKLIRCCGSGAYGDVWIAEDRCGLERAVKVLDIERLKRLNVLQREEKALNLFRNRVPSHPNLLNIYHIGQTDKHLYYVMDPADNLDATEDNYQADTLGTRLKRQGALPADEAVQLVTKLLEAVDCLHKAELVHRDIKPDNIIFINGEPKLADIGLAASTTQTLSIAGTLDFIPPEHSTGPEADLYALGKLLYCLVTGLPASLFPSLPDELLQDCSKELQLINRLILKACASDPKHRFHDTLEFMRALRGDSNALRTPFSNKYIVRFTLFVVSIISIIVTALSAIKDKEIVPKENVPAADPAPRRTMLMNEVDKEIRRTRPEYALAHLREIKKSWPKWAISSPEYDKLNISANRLKARVDGAGGTGSYRKYMSALMQMKKQPKESLRKMEEIWQDKLQRKRYTIITGYIVALEANGMYNKALEVTDYLVSLPVAKEANSAYKYRAKIYEKLGDNEKALLNLSTIIEKEPNNSEHLLARFVLNYKSGKKRAAYQDVLLVSKLLPDDPEIKAIRQDLSKEISKEKTAHQ